MLDLIKNTLTYLIFKTNNIKNIREMKSKYLVAVNWGNFNLFFFYSHKGSLQRSRDQTDM